MWVSSAWPVTSPTAYSQSPAAALTSPSSPVGSQASAHGVTGERLDPAEQPGATLHDRHRLGAQGAPGDGEPAADRPATEDDQPAWYRRDSGRLSVRPRR